MMVRLAAMQGGNEGDVIVILQSVGYGVLQFPVDVVYENEDAWTDCVAGAEHIVLVANYGLLYPRN